MKQLGSTIECYRGEAFTWRREFVDQDGAPLVLTQWMRNPFLRFTIKSNTYKIDGEYKKNYWTDLSHLSREKYAELGPARQKKLIAVEGNKFSSSSGTTVSQATDSVPKVTFTREGSNQYQMYILCESQPKFSTHIINFQCKFTAPTSKVATLKLLGDNGEILDQSNVNSETVQDVSFLVDGGYNRRLYMLLTIPAGTAGQYSFELWDIYGDYDVNQLYYKVTPDGREYYTVDYRGNESLSPYKFVVNRKFINADTKKWVGGIYQYEVALCSGELMTDWLKRVYTTLYSDTNIPNANKELAHYICKKRPDLLKGVNINEPLVSYETNQVLLGPSKLIVKEN